MADPRMASLGPPRSLKIDVSGLPKGKSASVTVSGPKGYKKTLTKSARLKKLTPGMYRISARNVKSGKYTYHANLSARRIVVRKNASANIDAAYLLPLRFNLKSLVGVGVLTQKKTRASAKFVSTNLIGVDKAGAEVSALVTGLANVKRVVISPTDQLFVEFSEPTVLKGSGSTCVLAVVDRASGLPTCVDESIGKLGWPSEDVVGFVAATLNPGMQFDGEGNLYYIAGLQTGVVIRKWAAGVYVDLLAADVQSLTNFLVLENGDVYVSGTSFDANGQWTHWLKRLDATGKAETIANTGTTFIQELPDNFIYFGSMNIAKYDGNDWVGVRRIDTRTGALDAKYWISSDYSDSKFPGIIFESKSQCVSGNQVEIPDCSTMNGVLVRAYSRVGDAGVVALGSDRNASTLAELSPVSLGFDISLKSVYAMASTGQKLAVAGISPQGIPGLILFDPQTGIATELMDASQAVDIRNIEYASDENALYFDGIQGADHTQVLGKYDLTNNLLVLNPVATGSVADLAVY